MSTQVREWLGLDSPLAEVVRNAADQAVNAYVENPTLVDEHVNIERATAGGGYERRQVFELVQNGADALLYTPELHGRGRIEVLLTDNALYCANEGAPVTSEGLRALLHSHLSAKRGFEIGRFGLGFKSVLAVSERPAVFSRSVSFEFDPEYTASRIQQALGPIERLPVLRVARPVDPEVRAEEDPLLAELMGWATTVVKLPRTREAPHLSEDLLKFPAQFLLFSRHVGSVRFICETPRSERTISMSQDENGVIELADGAALRRWRVISHQKRLTEKARSGAGEFSEREEVVIHWAVPVDHSTGRGRFWAFFPTHYETTLSGILNASWKTQEDRQNLLQGEFNEELIDAAASAIIEHCGQLSTPEDPGLHLDKFPARGREAPNWADERLTERVYRYAPHWAVLPDMDGVLRLPSDLSLHPAKVPAETLEIWASVPGRPSNWCHPTVETRDRRSRVERILPNSVATPAEWLEALLNVGTAEASAAALSILALIGDESLTGRTPAVLTQDGKWVAADPQRLFLLEEDRPVKGFQVVAAEVAARAEARSALESLGIRTLDALGELDAALATPLSKWESVDWERFWALTRRVSVDECFDLLERRGVHRKIEARTLGRGFRRILASLLQGEVVNAENSPDLLCIIDEVFHFEDMELLRRLGAVDGPRGGVDVTGEGWFRSYQDAQRERYVAELTGAGSRPQSDFLVLDQSEAVGPLTVLLGLSDEGRARFTRIALSQPGALAGWSMRHRTQLQYPALDALDNPTIWMLREHGAVDTSCGVRRCAQAFGAALYRWRRWLPVADLDGGTCDAIGIRNDLSSVPKKAWQDALERATTQNAVGDLGYLFAEAARAGVSAPVLLPALGGPEPVKPSQIVVVLSSDHESRLIVENSGEPFVLVDDPSDLKLLVDRWRFARLSAGHVEVLGVQAREPESAADVFPLLPLYVGDALNGLSIVRAEEVEVRIPGKNGTSTRAVTSHWDGGRLVVDDSVDHAALLELILTRADISLAGGDREDVLLQRALENVEELKKRCRAAGSDAERLLILIDVETLRGALPSGLNAAVTATRSRALSDHEIAELVLAVHGVEILAQFKPILDELSITVPPLYGGSRARRFVMELGFPVPFAGSRPEPRDPLLRVQSLPALPPLHDYQTALVDEVRRLVRRDGNARGLLSLPTGAGKTRVAAEAIIHASIDGDVRGPVVWIAQSDELCEQAVQTWSYLWSATAAGGTLAISRLWGSNEVEPVDDDLHVIVATINKLQVVHGHPDYEWLEAADCVVVDEAHGSTTPMYTEVLDWLGFTGRTTRTGTSLLGLTATPFRGTSETETGRLVARYGRHRLDLGVFGEDPYQELQHIGVLARVEHNLLGGSKLRLSTSELADLTRTHRLPKGVEQRVGEDQGRNQVLLEEIKSFPKDWTCLLFCASVQHAELMAALLTLEGIRAEAISASTNDNRRRHAIEGFRSGRIRVLTNYGVLTQGFDAPKVQAIVVARPTYSPNVYQQMIGRGLRGPANGGSESCLIVNVEDTVEQFGEQLAFRQFEHLWITS